MNASNTEPDTTAAARIVFSDTEARALDTLRRRYREDDDLFSPHELAQLRFLRWLVWTERLVV